MRVVAFRIGWPEDDPTSRVIQLVLDTEETVELVVDEDSAARMSRELIVPPKMGASA